MANADEMMVKITCTHINENLLVITAYRETDAGFLGNIGLLFAEPNDTDKFLNSYDKAWRSFIDFVDYKDGELKIYYRSADGGSEEFFQSLKDNFKESIESECITLSDDLYGEDLEFLQDEYGEDFCIEL